MLIATLQNLLEEHINEIAFHNEALLDLLSDGTEVAVLNMACYVDDTPERNYYDIAFSCGTIAAAVSGYHLDGIINWKD